MAAGRQPLFGSMLAHCVWSSPSTCISAAVQQLHIMSDEDGNHLGNWSTPSPDRSNYIIYTYSHISVLYSILLQSIVPKDSYVLYSMYLSNIVLSAWFWSELTSRLNAMFQTGTASCYWTPSSDQNWPVNHLRCSISVQNDRTSFGKSRVFSVSVLKKKFIPSHRMFGRMHGVLNVKKKLIAQFGRKPRDESFKPN
jgi:hypothetical protein